MKIKKIKKPIISALEQRILFDGAAVATVVDVLDNSSFPSNETTATSNDVTSNNAENTVHEAQAVQGFERDRREVAFVDATVSDYQTLVDGVGEGVEVYLVSSLDDINSILKNEINIDAIHILSHGTTGEITVGNDVLNGNTLDDNALLLETMKNSLSENGDILLYGCNVASNGEGQDFIDEFATITEADIAASDDITGAESLNGDWDLEVESGDIESEAIVVEAFGGELGTPSISNLDASNTFTEDGSAVIIDNNVTFSNGGSYTEGELKFSIGSADSSETLTLTSSTNVNGNGEISVVGSDVYLGNGSGRDRIGSIDSYYDGTNGKDLKILFSSPLLNSGFEDGTSNWDIQNQEYKGSSGLELDFDGYTIPLANDSSSLYNGGTGTVNTVTNSSTTFTGSVVSGAGIDSSNALKLISSGGIVAEDQDPQGGGYKDDGYGSIHGPYATSDVITVENDDSISLEFSAKGSGDDYEVFGLLREVDANGNFIDTTTYGTANTNNNIILFAERGEDTGGYKTVTYNNLQSGNYKFQFIGGTYDGSGGYLVGSELYVDNIRLISSTSTNDAVVSKIAQQISYHNSDQNPPPSKTITISAISQDGLTGSDSIIMNITPVNDLPFISGISETSVNEDGNINISGFTISDVDATDLTVQVTAAHGVLSLSTTTGITGYTAGNTLTLTGSASNLQNALNSLNYKPDANYNGTDELDIKISDDSGSTWHDYYVDEIGKFYNPDNGHYYEYVSTSGITWAGAKTAAEARTLYGLQGYLATVTSQAENEFIAPKLGGAGWMGASDEAEEGVWKWVTGPEVGTQFWSGAAGGSAVNGEYENWNSGEPNDSGANEDYAQYLDTGGIWNDLSSTHTLNGYVVEYGGLGGSESLAAAKIAITVNAVNDAPTFTLGSNQTINEDAGLQTISNFVTGIDEGGGSDEDSQTLTFNTTNNNNSLFSTQPSISSDGILTYTAAENAYGTATVNVMLTDNGGTANSGVNTTSKTFTITVNPVNDDVLVSSAIDTGAVVENGTAQTTGTVNFTDLDTIDNHSIEFSQKSNDYTKDMGTFSVVKTTDTTGTGTGGVVTWTYDINVTAAEELAEGQVVTEVYTITINDNNGDTVSQDVTITITGTNDAPAIQVVDVSANILEGSVLSDNGSITFTDLDLTDRAVATEATASVGAIQQDGTTELPLTASQILDIESAFSISNLLSNTNDGTVIWGYSITENKLDFLGEGEVVTAVFTITVTDDEGTIATQDVTVTITGTNDAPTVSFENVDDKTPFGKDFTKEIAYLFSDKDLTNVFNFEAINLPRGLVIDSSTGVISGSAKESGIFQITLIGKDSGNPSLSVSRTFSLLVIAPAQPESIVVVNTPNIGDSNTNNNDITLNNFNDNGQNNLGVLNYSSFEGVSSDTGVGFLSNVTNTNDGIAQNNGLSNNQTEQAASNNVNGTNSTNTNNDNKGLIQADVDLNVLTNGQIVFNQGNQDAFSIVGITVEDIKIENTNLDIKVVDTNFSQNFIVTQIDGSALPQGLSFDPRTGNISGIIPENLDKLNLSIKAINQDGTTRILNLKLDLKELRNKNQVEADEKYIGLKEQIALENQRLDGYGSYLTKLFA